MFAGDELQAMMSTVNQLQGQFNAYVKSSRRLTSVLLALQTKNLADAYVVTALGKLQDVMQIDVA